MIQRIGGDIIQLMADGQLYDIQGDFTYNLGAPKREMKTGGGRVVGWTEKTQVPFIEGKAFDRGGLSVKTLVNLKNITVTLTLANGKVIMLSGAVYAGDGNVTTESAEVDLRFEGERGEEV